VRQVLAVHARQGPAQQVLLHARQLGLPRAVQRPVQRRRVTGRQQVRVQRVPPAALGNRLREVQRVPQPVQRHPEAVRGGRGVLQIPQVPQQVMPVAAVRVRVQVPQQFLRAAGGPRDRHAAAQHLRLPQ